MFYSRIEKLKKDQQNINANIFVLMTMTLPKEIDNFGLYNDIWITNYQTGIGLCTMLRETLNYIKNVGDSIGDNIFKFEKDL